LPVAKFLVVRTYKPRQQNGRARNAIRPHKGRLRGSAGPRRLCDGWQNAGEPKSSIWTNPMLDNLAISKPTKDSLTCDEQMEVWRPLKQFRAIGA
jgi:hypothetical protein